jgi:hypothetical protein
LKDIVPTALELAILYGDVQVAKFCTIAILWVFDTIPRVHMLTTYHRHAKKQTGRCTGENVELLSGG